MTDERKGGISKASVSFGSGERAVEEAAETASVFRISVLSNVVPEPSFQVRAPQAARPVPFDKHSLDAIFCELCPGIQLSVVDPLVPGRKLAIDLRFQGLRSLRPADLAKEVKELAALVEAASAIRGALGDGSNPDQVRTRVRSIVRDEAWVDALLSGVSAPPTQTVATAPKPPAAIDHLLLSVDLPSTEEEPAAPSPLSSLVATVARGGIGKGPRGLAEAESMARAAAQDMLRSIVAHPEMRRLEQAWHSLRLVCTQGGGPRVLFEVVPVAVDDVHAALASYDEGAWDGDGPPVDLFVVDASLKPTPHILSLVRGWGEVASRMSAPVVLSCDASWIGYASVAEIARSRTKLSTATSPTATAVRALATSPDMRWVAATLNAVLLRTGYSTESSRLRGLTLEEGAEGDLYAHPGIGIAALCAKSFGQSGWGALFADAELTDLPVAERGGEHHVALPLEVALPQDVAGELSAAGFASLSCARNQDKARAASGTTLFRASENARATASLAGQLFVGRVTQALGQLAGAMPRGGSAAAAAEVTEIALAELFQGMRPIPDLQVKPAQGGVNVTIKPRGFAGLFDETYTLTLPVGGSR